MKPFVTLTTTACLLDASNVDTDQIIPKQFLKRIERTGFGKFLFFDWRYKQTSPLVENPDFCLNKAEYKGAKILLSRKNFGCGSSREHAPWAIEDYGFLCIIAESFADIFYNNCFQNGILPIQLDEKTIEMLFQTVSENAKTIFHIDLEAQKIEMRLDSNSTPKAIPFDIETEKKEKLLKGLDDIGITLQYSKYIEQYESQ